MVSTIYVVGVPADATYRELENSVRFLYGYEAFKVAPTKGRDGSSAIFVKFDSPANANAALKLFHGVPYDTQYPDYIMKVEMARSDMKSSPGGGPPPIHQPPPPIRQPPPPRLPHPAYSGHAPASPAGNGYGGGSWDGGAEQDGGAPRRARVAENPSGVDTIVLLGAFDKGFTEGQLEEYFSQMPGFVAWKPSDRVAGGFVKFESHDLALAAIEHAEASDIPAQIARTSMNFGGDSGAGGTPPPHGYQPVVQLSPLSSAPAPKRARSDEEPSMVDTIVLFGVTSKGFTEPQLEDFFQSVPGFVAIKVNNKNGNAFVKFSSPMQAQDAIDTAAGSGLEAVMAKTSMNA